MGGGRAAFQSPAPVPSSTWPSLQLKSKPRDLWSQDPNSGYKLDLARPQAESLQPHHSGNPELCITETPPPRRAPSVLTLQCQSLRACTAKPRAPVWSSGYSKEQAVPCSSRLVLAACSAQRGLCHLHGHPNCRDTGAQQQPRNAWWTEHPLPGPGGSPALPTGQRWAHKALWKGEKLQQAEGPGQKPPDFILFSCLREVARKQMSPQRCFLAAKCCS